ncbi:LCR [Medicago truncatula]|uniref:LCR n=1 Tax=Medicago truncatula TaxID=3880 RepID=A0A072TZM9_MEDTR|nr:LCR [Medicago truncatula]
MAKYISQYFLLGLLCIALVLASGPTPSLSNDPHIDQTDRPCIAAYHCSENGNCDKLCREIGYKGGDCNPGYCCCDV